MRIKLLTENLQKKIAYLNKVIAHNPSLPILQNILLDASEQEISLSATDLQSAIRIFLRSEVENPQKIAVPAKIFIETIKNLPAGEIVLEQKDKQLLIKTKASRSKILLAAAEDYPEFSPLPEARIDLDLPIIKSINQYIAFSCSTDRARLLLTTILLIQDRENLQIVGTDGFRLAVLNIKQLILADGQKLLLPSSALLEVARILENESLTSFQLGVLKDLKQLVFILGDITYYVRLVEGEFPPYEKIIPTVFSHKISFISEDVEKQLKQALVMAKEASNIINFEFNQDKLLIKAKSSAFGEYQGEVEIENNNKQSNSVAFNARYLQDLIGNVKSERLEMSMNDKLKPILFAEPGNEHFIYVVMPFRLNE